MIAPVLPALESPKLQSGFEMTVAATANDPELRELLRNSPVPGPISVTFEREPSFFDSCTIRGDFVQACIARDRRTARIVGVGTRSISTAFLNGEPTSLGYLADLRLMQQYRGGMLIARGYRFLRHLHQDGRTRLYTTLIFNGNHNALATIASGRAGLPRYHDQGKILSPGINIRRPRPPIKANCEIMSGTEELLPEIVECLNRNHARRQFAPLHAVSTFRQRCRNFRIQDFHVAIQGSKVVGVLGSWDQRPFKQTRVTGYSKRLRWMLPFANAIRPITGGPLYPKPGEEVPYCYFGFAAVDGDDLQVFRSLLRSAYNAAVGSEYLYAILALHERDPLLPVLQEYSLTPFSARLYCVSYDDGEDYVRQLDRRVPYLEAATF